MSIGEVLPTNEARARLNAIAAGFDADGSHAEPVVFGSHRRAQGVIVSWELWQRIAPAVEDVLDEELATRRLAATKGKGAGKGQGAGKWLTRAEVDAKLGRGKVSGE